MQKVNCAIYVRKSTEKGLEQEFNSLHNQEEACRSYILSQTYNGWEYYQTYEDGGISGGTMKRPGLKKMLSDMKKGLIQVVVVYKVDRLSRSIIDFHNMMKEFEKHNCSFVSITQAFDTSTSMGKLTLNMLLSFAQFEREVSAERVRDKIAASKKKGFWTGGCPPMGYDVLDKKLLVNRKEAEQVRFIFKKYLEIRSLSGLKDFLARTDIRTKIWTSQNGLQRGGRIFSTSMLARILRSQVYIGRIESKKDGISYPGKHKGIVNKDIFKQVQEIMDENRNKLNRKYSKLPYLLSKKLYDRKGNVFKNQQSRKNGNLRYRYYALKGKYLPSGDIDEITISLIFNLLAHPLESLVGKSRAFEFKAIDFSSMKPNEQKKLIRAMVNKVIYYDDKLTYFIKADDLNYLKPFQRENFLNEVKSTDNIENRNINFEQENPTGIGCNWNNQNNQNRHTIKETSLNGDNDTVIFISQNTQELVIEKKVCFNGHPLSNRYVGNGKQMITIGENQLNLIKALSIGWRYEKMSQAGDSIKKVAEKEKKAKRTIYKYLDLNYLSPNIVNDIMESKTPSHINLQELFKIASKHPDFNDQERIFYDLNVV